MCDAYTAWKKYLVTSSGAPSGAARVQDPQGPPAGRTVSEGMGYGMLISVFMEDKTTFDQLWAYVQAKSSGGLMIWQLDSSGNAVNGDNHSATDADEDIAWALLMADKQWGGSYLNSAKSMIGTILSNDVNGSTLRPGDYSGSGPNYPDYAAPAYYGDFGTASGNASAWSSVTTGEYGVLTGAQNGTTGLIPDTVGGSTFGYDACRAPLRIGEDYCFNGSSNAKSFLSKMVTWFSGQGVTALGLTMPVGGPAGGSPTGAMSGPAGVAAMSGTDQTFVNSSFSRTYQLSTGVTGSPLTLNYFGSSLGMISLLVMSGNMFDYTH